MVSVIVTLRRIYWVRFWGEFLFYFFHSCFFPFLLLCCCCLGVFFFNPAIGFFPLLRQVLRFTYFHIICKDSYINRTLSSSGTAGVFNQQWGPKRGYVMLYAILFNSKNNGPWILESWKNFQVTMLAKLTKKIMMVRLPDEIV